MLRSAEGPFGQDTADKYIPPGRGKTFPITISYEYLWSWNQLCGNLLLRVMLGHGAKRILFLAATIIPSVYYSSLDAAKHPAHIDHPTECQKNKQKFSFPVVSVPETGCYGNRRNH